MVKINTVEDMEREVTVEGVEDIPEDVRVCHYDELDEPAKERFPQLVDRERGFVDDHTAAGFGNCEFVKFTDYYRVDVR